MFFIGGGGGGWGAVSADNTPAQRKPPLNPPPLKPPPFLNLALGGVLSMISDFRESRPPWYLEHSERFLAPPSLMEVQKAHHMVGSS